VAAIYEGTAPADWELPQDQSADQGAALTREPVRTRLVRWLREQDPAAPVAAPDQASDVTYVAETGPWEAFGSRLWSEMWARGMGRLVQDVVVVADGSDHIEQVVDNELRLPGIQVTRILDSAHAQQHLWAMSAAAFGESSAACRAWVQLPLTALERGQVATVLAALEALALKGEQAPPGVAERARKTAAYFAQRREQVNYPCFVAAGKHIGSGLAESACKRFGTDRMKGAGMRWTIRGAQCVATLRTFVLSERWPEVSNYCRRVA
jgi:hypothetical protein